MGTVGLDLGILVVFSNLNDSVSITFYICMQMYIYTCIDVYLWPLQIICNSKDILKEYKYLYSFPNSSRSMLPVTEDASASLSSMR